MEGEKSHCQSNIHPIFKYCNFEVRLLHIALRMTSSESADQPRNHCPVTATRWLRIEEIVLRTERFYFCLFSSLVFLFHVTNQ